MFYLHRSNRSERLVRRLISLIADSKRPDPFTVEHFLIQSQGMERFLSQQLAAAFTAWCNFEYRHPVRFFDDLGRRLDLPPAENYQREQLAWRIDSLLRDLTGETFAPLLRYIHGEQEELKRFQLAGRLAHLFDQYQLMRPDMLEAWDKGRLVSQNPDEKWQALLWARLRREGHVGVFHRGEFLRELGRFLFEEQVDRSQLPARLFVFGLSSLPPLLLSCLYGLARHSDVHFFLLSPTNQYWGDMVRPITLARSRLQKATQDDDGLQCEPHPLLASMGSHGREFLELLLNSYEEIEDNEDFEEPAAKEGAGVLHQIQAGLYHGQPQPLEKVAGDDSIRIVSCHSRLRELEVLKEHVMGILHDHRDMTLSDIIVMTPKIQDYSLLIGQVFDDVPHSIGDRSLDRASRLPLLLLQFFQLARGRCGWSPVLDFLEMDEVYPGFGLCEPDLEKIRCWVTDSGIRWGLSPDHRAGFGLPPVNETSWQAGLERLMMGWAVSSKEAVNSIFPYLQIEGGRDGEILGGLCHYIETLSKGERDFSVSRSVQEWVELIFHYCEHLFGERDREGVERLRELMADLVKLLGDSYHHEVEAAVIEEWLRQSIESRTSSSGFLSGQLTFCSMLPMRSIPFRAVCLLGLNDSVFPAQDRPLSFDLLRDNHRLGDRSKRDDDRYQFLEAILSVRDVFYLSYVGQSQRSNEKIEPSGVISELLEFGRSADNETLSVEFHPLHSFSQKYFQKDSQLRSYDERSCRLAGLLAGDKEDQRPWFSGKLAQSTETRIELSDLFSFFQDPQRWFVNRRLDIHLQQAEEKVPDHEMFEQSLLERYFSGEEIIAHMLSGAEEEELLQRLQASGRWMLGTQGELYLSQQLDELSPFVQSLQALNLGAPLPPVRVEVSIGDHVVCGELGNLYEHGMLLARWSTFKGSDLFRGWLSRLVLSGAGYSEKKLYLLSKDRAKFTIVETGSAEEQLQELVQVYLDGYQQPSPLWTEPAFAYVLQKEKARALKSPLAAAQDKLNYLLGLWPKPEQQLFMRHRDHSPLDEEFVQLCEELVGPVWREVNG